jgi:hypothetical protein
MSGPDLIIGIDPGDTTGLAYWYPGAGRPIAAVAQIRHCREDYGLSGLFRELGQITPLSVQGTAIVCESFEFRHEERYRDKIDYTAAEVIGALRTFVLERPSIELFRQNAATAKGFWTDDKLKRLGVWVPGNKHAMDATRHLLRYRTFELDHRYLLKELK